jgi:RimJ/RimL family protein N-acetyltransferase
MTCLEELRSEQIRERSIPVLETERLVLRAPRLGDAKTVAALANDRRIAENTARIPHPYKRADADDWIASANTRADEETYLITLADGTIIGACGFDMREDGVPDVGYWLGVEHWGKGYATEAVRALIDRAFCDLAYDALHSGARVTNPASRHVLEKCGFQWTGVGLCRIRALKSSAPIDRFRLERGIWLSLMRWGQMKPVVRRVA